MALRTPAPVRTVQRIVGRRPFTSTGSAEEIKKDKASPASTSAQNAVGTPSRDEAIESAAFSLRAFSEPRAKARPTSPRKAGAAPQPGKPTPTSAAAAAAVPEDLLPAIGTTDDQVWVEINGKRIVIAESYEVEVGIFTQPSAFSMTFGHGGVLSDLLKEVQPRSSFKLYVGDALVQSGFIDAIRCGGEAAIVEVSGRDLLQDIHDSYTQKEWTFHQKSYVAFIEECYRQAGLEPPAIDVADAAKNRLMAAGKALPPPAKAREQLQITRPVAMTLGERFYDHIKRVLDRGGLFLRSAPDGRLILTAPNAEHPVLFKAVHAPRGVNDRGSVVDYAFTNSTVDRVRTYVVYSRGGGGGGHTPHTKLFGGVEDIEMKGYGYNRVRSYRDWHVKTNDEAELMARRRMAEARRRSWNLTLTVSGHRTRLYGTEELGVWRPDCMVRFESDQLDMRDTFYIETVRFSRGPNGTFTHLRLLRRQDLIFGLEDF